MRFLHQTRFGDGSDGTPPGNCVATCYASLLGLPLSDIPELCGTGNQLYAEETFLRSLGLGLLYVPLDARPRPVLSPNIYHMISGMSPRGYRHRVVGRGGRVAHDPHPDGSGLVSEDAWLFWTPLGPAGHAARLGSRA